MPSTTATASAISRPRSVRVPSFFGSFGMRLDRTHAELASPRLAQSSCVGSQFTVKSLARIKQATAHLASARSRHPASPCMMARCSAPRSRAEPPRSIAFVSGHDKHRRARESPRRRALRLASASQAKKGVFRLMEWDKLSFSSWCSHCGTRQRFCMMALPSPPPTPGRLLRGAAASCLAKSHNMTCAGFPCWGNRGQT